MKKILVFLSVLLFLSVNVACMKKVEPAAEKITRNIELVIKDNQGVPILRVTCDYLGKQPKGDLAYKIKWQEGYFDFHNWTFENLTDDPIIFVKQKRYSQHPREWTHYVLDRKTGKTTTKKVPDTVWKDFKQKPLWEDNILKPRATFVKKNTFIGCGTKENKRNYEFFIEYKKNNYNFTIYKIQSVCPPKK